MPQGQLDVLYLFLCSFLTELDVERNLISKNDKIMVYGIVRKFEFITTHIYTIYIHCEIRMQSYDQLIQHHTYYIGTHIFIAIDNNRE